MTNANFRLSRPRTGFHIPIIGCIASGKSSFCHALAHTIEKDTCAKCREFLEPAAKEDGYASVFLPKFYADPKRWSFATQIEMLTVRRKQTRLAQTLAFNGENSVADSSVWSDSVFVNLLQKMNQITDEEADLYFELFHQMSEDFLYPQAFVYLAVSPETAKRRLDKRLTEKEGRKMESDISLGYLAGLIAEYNELCSNLSRFSHVIRLDWNEDRTVEQIETESFRVWSQVKMLTKDCPIPCGLIM